MSRSRAVLLSGSLGLGHEMLVRSCASLLTRAGWEVESVDCMRLLGKRAGRLGGRAFTRTVRAVPSLYDGLHFGHLRTGSRVAQLLDAGACHQLVPALAAQLRDRPADLVLSVFATGASAAAKLRRAGQTDARAVVLCTDVTFHRLWVEDGTDLFLATSDAAAASVLRYLPRAQVAVVPPPVRPGFYDAPSAEDARDALGVPRGAPCALLIDSGWGFGPAEQTVAALAAEGVHVLAVAGRHAEIEARFRSLAHRDPRVHAFGFVDDVPGLMAASDLVLTLPGATTCSEARVMDRPLLLLDAMPGHGRENLLHELELGDARTCGRAPAEIVEAALALLEARAARAPRAARARASPAARARWEPAFARALASVGVELSPGAWRSLPPAAPAAPRTRPRARGRAPDDAAMRDAAPARRG